jgi:hypothetical protein
MPSSRGDAKQDSASREDAIDRPLEYLATSSDASIESFHLSRLNTVANLRKELHEIFEEWVEAEVQARLARWLLARKNPEHAADGAFVAIESVDRRSAGPAATRPAPRAATRTATAESASGPNSARLEANRSAESNDSSVRSTTRLGAARATNRATRKEAARLISCSNNTRSGIVCCKPGLPAVARSNSARESVNTSKFPKATSTLLSFRRPNRNRAAS